VLATEDALDRTWDVPHREREGFLASRLRALLLLVVLGAAVLASTVLSGLVGGGAVWLGALGGVAISAALNLGLFAAVFHLLASAELPLRASLPGAVLAAVLWTGLQLLGGLFVSHEVRGAAPVYGTFALVIGLLAWIHLGAMLTVLAAELNVVWRRRLWPRGLSGDAALAGPRRGVAASAAAER
jgi:uncharacterized BrkB/YihY/UPF0761 family membrane protein